QYRISGHHRPSGQQRTSILLSPTAADCLASLTAHNKEVAPSGILVRSNLNTNTTPPMRRRSLQWRGSTSSSFATGEDTFREGDDNNLSLSQLPADAFGGRSSSCCGSGSGRSNNNDDERENNELENIIALIQRMRTQEGILKSSSE
ncbi:uncharacterized protein TM35_000441730, partial [Trypanosoma theileri]